MKYDDAAWHYGGDYPAELPPEGGATHIGMFMAWAIERGLVGELHKQESAAALTSLRNHSITGAEFLLEECDGKFTNEDLDDTGNAFAVEYYEAKYVDDYVQVFDDENLETIYHIEDTWENYERLKPVLDRRFSEWRTEAQR